MNIGDKWNNWTVEGVLGSGSFGKVYKITRHEFGHKYESALKIIRIPQDPAEVNIARNEGMSDDQITEYFYGIVEQIVSEFALMSDLRGNSNIVSYEDHSVTALEGTVGWEIAIRMELLSPLFDYIRKHDYTLMDVIKLGIDMCKAIETCNAHDIIHRDIKPENIFVSRDGDYKLGDFGIARKLEETSSEMSKKGTVSYMAPEVYKGQAYDKTVDLYSLGIVIYRLLNNNRTPFLPPPPDKVQYVDRIAANNSRMRGDQIPAPANADGELADIVLKACAYNPQDRFRSATEMREALESFLYRARTVESVMQLTGDGSERSGRSVNLSLGSSGAYGDSHSADSGSRVPSSAPGPTSEISGSDSDETLPEIRNSAEDDDLTVRSETTGAPSGQSVSRTSDAEPAAIEPAAKPAGDAGAGKSKRPSKIIAAIFAILIIAAAPFIYKYFHNDVPMVVGMEAGAAKSSIEEAGLAYEEVRDFSDDTERNKVMSQTHEGEAVRKGTTIVVVVSKGKAIMLDNIEGISQEKAEKKLSDNGLVLDVNGTEYSDTLKKGLIISQDPEAGSACEEGDVVSVVVSAGITQVEVPDVVGKNSDEAVKLLEKSGLKADVSEEYSSNVESGRIISQSIKHGKKVDKNSTVSISKSIGPQPVTRSSGGSRKKSGKKKKSSGGSGEVVFD